MNRRTLVASVAASVLLPRVAIAQATPTPEPRYVSEFVTLTGLIQARYLYATQRNMSLDGYLDGALYWVETYAFRFEQEAFASLAPGRMAQAFVDWAEFTKDYKYDDLAPASARAMGDDSSGWVADGIPADPDDDPWSWAQFSVQKGANVVLLSGTTAMGATLSRLADIAERFDDDWNAETKVMPAMIPDLDDLDEGMSIEDEFDATRSFKL